MKIIVKAIVMTAVFMIISKFTSQILDIDYYESVATGTLGIVCYVLARMDYEEKNK